MFPINCTCSQLRPSAMSVWGSSGLLGLLFLTTIVGCTCPSAKEITLPAVDPLFRILLDLDSDDVRCREAATLTLSENLEMCERAARLVRGSNASVDLRSRISQALLKARLTNIRVQLQLRFHALQMRFIDRDRGCGTIVFSATFQDSENRWRFTIHMDPEDSLDRAVDCEIRTDDSESLQIQEISWKSSRNGEFSAHTLEYRGSTVVETRWIHTRFQGLEQESGTCEREIASASSEALSLILAPFQAERLSLVGRGPEGLRLSVFPPINDAWTALIGETPGECDFLVAGSADGEPHPQCVGSLSKFRIEDNRGRCAGLIEIDTAGLVSSISIRSLALHLSR